MSERWSGNGATESKSSLANHLLQSLQLLHANPSLTTKFVSRVSHGPPHSAPLNLNHDAEDASPRNGLSVGGDGRRTKNVMSFGEPTVMESRQGLEDHPVEQHAAHLMSPSQVPDCGMSMASGGTDELSDILKSFSDEHFMGMDRVISFDGLGEEGLYNEKSLALTQEAKQPAWDLDSYQWLGPDTQR